MVRASEHPDFEKEDQYLQNTLAVIAQNLSRAQEPRNAVPAYRNAAQEVRRLRDEEATDLQQALEEPYFARVDFTRDGDDAEQSIYIGKFGVQDLTGPHIVFNWRARIAELYYNQQWQNARYTGREGEICGNVTLRRKYKIRRRQLSEIFDEAQNRHEFVQPPSELSDRVGKTAMPIDQFLHDTLAEPRSAKLRDIVATIQPEQYALIEAPLEGVLVVQGVAGSGKTSLALHRLAVLLYRHQKTLATNRMLVIGPSALFLHSVSDILPGLGVEGIRQMTFADWARSWLGGALKVESRSVQVEHLIDPAFEQRIGSTEHRLLAVAASFLYKFKGSMRMASLLQAHLAAMKKTIPAHARAIQITYAYDRGDYDVLRYGRSIVVPLTFSEEEVRKSVEQELSASAPDNLRIGMLRESCVENIIEQLWKQFRINPEYRPSLPLHGDSATMEKAKREWEEREGDRRTDFGTVIRDSVRSSLNEWWPTVTHVNCYRTLIANRDRLARAAAEAATTATAETPFHEWELELLFTPDAQRRDYRWSEDDLAPLCYIALLLKGLQDESYDHIFIDEVQDLSPLELYLLRTHARASSMTLVGDVAQGIGRRGVRTLSELDSALGDTTITHAVINTSYRSTAEITEFANRLLAQLPFTESEHVIARPVARHGSDPELIRCSSRRQMLSRIGELVIDAQNRGRHSIAVICKTVETTKEVAESLRVRRLPVMPVLTQDDPVQEGIIVVPVYLAKGLEFDTVLVVDTDDTTYTHSEYDVKLLYVAVTRALHELHLLYVGNASPFLA